MNPQKLKTTPADLFQIGDEHLAEAMQWLAAAEATYNEAGSLTTVENQALIEIKLAEVEASIAIAAALLAEQLRQEQSDE